MIAVIDYEMGNVGSILNMLRKIRASAKLTAERNEIQEAKGIILPGVGSFDHGMHNLKAKDLCGLLKECVMEQKIPLLGICLGMQLLTKNSEEGCLSGLGLINAETRRFRFEEKRLRIPHMGWNYINVKTPKSAGDQTLANQLFRTSEPNSRYYFVHSFHVCCESPEDVLATANYGYDFSAAIGFDNCVGTQFHPEKSLHFGVTLMRSFVNFAMHLRKYENAP